MFDRLRFNIFPKSESITVCIPAYNAATFIEETVESVLHQTHSERKLIISVDQSNDRTTDKIRAFEKNKRVKIFEQKKHLGWVGNTNFLLRRVRSPYFMILPHDDILNEDYLQILLENLKKNSQAVACFSDIGCFGDHEGVIAQSSVVGSQFERIKDYLLSHYNAVVFRALIDRRKIKQRILLTSNHFNDFSSDTIFGLNLVLHGELLRHPQVLYRKRYHPQSYHSLWQKWPPHKMMDAWSYHCLEILAILHRHGFTESDPEEIKDYIQQRFTQSGKNLWQRSVLQNHLNDAKAIENFRKKVTNILASNPT
ncbi:MAG: glycosyltransferase [Saprospiraceae bacterium]|nr:glycosyltransferase [Saprospiraceae bacterium]